MVFEFVQSLVNDVRCELIERSGLDKIIIVFRREYNMMVSI